MSEGQQEEQVNTISASQENLNMGDPMQNDAQDLLAGSQEEVINLIDNPFKRNKIKSFLNRIKEDISGIKDAMLDLIAPSIINEDFQEIIEMVKTYNKLN